MGNVLKRRVGQGKLTERKPNAERLLRGTCLKCVSEQRTEHLMTARSPHFGRLRRGTPVNALWYACTEIMSYLHHIGLMGINRVEPRNELLPLYWRQEFYFALVKGTWASNAAEPNLFFKCLCQNFLIASIIGT